MQTFLPYADFERCAKVLDRQRLGKQRVECKQILKALQSGGGWANHPATRMWAGHEGALIEYAIAVCREWIGRGYNDNQLPWFTEQMRAYDSLALPEWIGRDDVHASHRARLLHKDPEWYGRFGWTETPRSDEEGYVWPVAA